MCVHRVTVFFIIVIFTTAMLEILMISTNMFTVCLQRVYSYTPFL